MPTEFELDRSKRIVYSRAWGDLTDAELLDHMAKMRGLLEQGALDSTWAQVFDLSDAKNLDEVSSAGVGRLAKGNPWPKGSIRVVIAPSDLLYGLTRMYQLIGDPKTEAVHIARQRNEAEAFIAYQRAQLGEAI